MALNEQMIQLGQVRSVIRETFEYGNRRAAEIGRENVFDFSLGNPSIPSPPIFTQTLEKLLREEDPVTLHGYTSAPGAPETRTAIADFINCRYAAGLDADDIYMTCGAAASLTISLRALCNPGDEVVIIAPFFPEYRVFIESVGAKAVVVEADTKRFQINLKALAECVNRRTKAVIINTPNNPTGVVLDEETITRLCALLRERSSQYGSPIYLITDEPYRALVYNEDVYLPYLINEYTHTLVCTSFSKSLSLPGERIGYIAVSNRMIQHRDVYSAICGAGRALGYVCAPSLMQRAIIPCLDVTADLNAYRENRDLLYHALTEYGYECIPPDGAFYLFVRALEEDAKAFCRRAREFELLLVPSDSFGCTGYVRISYCVTNEMIRRSLPAFRALADAYRMTK